MLGEEAEIPERLVKNYGKKSMLHNDFNEESQNFLENFQISLRVLSKRTKLCMQAFSFALTEANYS